MSSAVYGEGADFSVPWHYGNPVAEQRAWLAGRGIADLSHLGFLRVSGPDRLTWLDSISSYKVRDIQAGQYAETLVMDAQGHIRHAAGFVDDGEVSYLIVDSTDAQAMESWLVSMRFMLRVEIENLGKDWGLIGEPATRNPSVPPNVGGSSSNVIRRGVPAFRWQDPWPAVAEGGTSYFLGSEHPGADWSLTLRAVPRAKLSAELAASEANGSVRVGTWALEALRVAAGRPRFSHEVDEKSLPHELDWLRTAVYLEKGCYPGQETVAKVFNVGRPPRRLTQLLLDGSVDVLPDRGDPVRCGGKQVGTITSAARHHELGPIALALLKRNTPADVELAVHTAAQVTVAASQEILVDPSGEATDRPQFVRPALRVNPELARPPKG